MVGSASSMTAVTSFWQGTGRWEAAWVPAAKEEVKGQKVPPVDVAERDLLIME